MADFIWFTDFFLVLEPPFRVFSFFTVPSYLTLFCCAFLSERSFCFDGLELLISFRAGRFCTESWRICSLQEDLAPPLLLSPLDLRCPEPLPPLLFLNVSDRLGFSEVGSVQGLMMLGDYTLLLTFWGLNLNVSSSSVCPSLLAKLELGRLLNMSSWYSGDSGWHSPRKILLDKTLGLAMLIFSL